MKSHKLALLTACVVCLATSNLVAQDYSTKTLSFNDITSTNLNQNVEQQASNEKEIEFADYDMDGDLDVAMAVARNDFGQRRNKLYRNDNGVLNEVTNSVISGFLNTDTSRSVFLRDFTGDGFPDIVIINDSNSGVGTINSPGTTKFYENDNGTSFFNATDTRFPFVNNTPPSQSYHGAACNGCVADFDNNGWLDVFLVNYPNDTQDELLLNNDGNFTRVTLTNMPGDGNYGVHGEAADMNGDGKVDILVGNRTNENNFIYYNNLNNQGSGDGDFSYGGGNVAGRFLVPESAPGVAENALVPCDFNNDGLMDMYFANSRTSLGDSIYVNTGNGGNGMAQFQIIPLMSELNGETFKVTCSDLDNDGRMDAVVMSEDRRPYILRNTSENGEISFVDWTPSSFNATHEGWQANMGDVSGNGRQDILVGALNDDFLFENVDSEITQYDDLTGGILPSFVNSAPIAIEGTIEGGETLTFIGAGVTPGARISMLTRSANADLAIDVSINGVPVANSDREGEDVDEAVTFTLNTSGTILIEVTNNSSGVLLGDVNMDGVVNLVDVAPFVAAIGGDYIAQADMNQDGSVDLLDVSLFIDALSNGGTGGGAAEFIAEFVGRTN